MLRFFHLPRVSGLEDADVLGPVPLLLGWALKYGSLSGICIRGPCYAPMVWIIVYRSKSLGG